MPGAAPAAAAAAATPGSASPGMLGGVSENTLEALMERLCLRMAPQISRQVCEDVGAKLEALTAEVGSQRAVLNSHGERINTLEAELKELRASLKEAPAGAGGGSSDADWEPRWVEVHGYGAFDQRRTEGVTRGEAQQWLTAACGTAPAHIKDAMHEVQVDFWKNVRFRIPTKRGTAREVRDWIVCGLEQGIIPSVRQGRETRVRLERSAWQKAQLSRFLSAADAVKEHVRAAPPAGSGGPPPEVSISWPTWAVLFGPTIVVRLSKEGKYQWNQAGLAAIGADSSEAVLALIPERT